MAQTLEERRAKKRAGAQRRRAANPELSREYMKRWEAAHPGRQVKKQKAWYYADPERARAMARASYHKHHAKRKALREQRRDVLRARGRAWRLAHLEQDAAKSRRRHARKRGATGSHTLAQFRALCEQNGWLCSYCSRSLTKRTVTEDHMTPISRGGSDDISNITPACVSCNSRKCTRTYDEFISENAA